MIMMMLMMMDDHHDVVDDDDDDHDDDDDDVDVDVTGAEWRFNHHYRHVYLEPAGKLHITYILFLPKQRQEGGKAVCFLSLFRRIQILGGGVETTN